jgi:hypothetical protein
MASMIKNSLAFTELLSHTLDKTKEPALGKFSTKVKISMIISNSIQYKIFLHKNFFLISELVCNKEESGICCEVRLKIKFSGPLI